MSRGKLLNTNLTALFDVIRPIGSLYSTVDSTFNPNNASGWHGTWERITDCMIYASGDSDTVGEIVGSNTHSLNEYELPQHNHTIPALSGTATGGNHHHASFSQSTPYGRDWNPTGGQLTSSSTGQLTWSSNTGNSGNLSLSVTTNASNTGNAGASTPIDLRSKRINSIVWKRVS